METAKVTVGGEMVMATKKQSNNNQLHETAKETVVTAMGMAMVTETLKVTAGGGGDGGGDSNGDGDGNGDNINNQTTINYTWR
jgi:hypothetical protein